MAALFSFLARQTKPAYENLNVEEFKNKIKTDSPVILDVRSKMETNGGKITKAKVFDVNSPDFVRKIANLDREKTYLVYCRSGARSAMACKFMSKNGFENLYNLKGGYMAWSRS